MRAFLIRRHGPYTSRCCQYTLPYLKWIINKDLLYSTGNSAQCYLSAWMGREFGQNGYMCIYGWVPLLSLSRSHHRGVGQRWLLQGRGHWGRQCVGPSEGGGHYLLYLQFGLTSNNREGTQPHPSVENWIKDLLSMAPSIRTRPSFLQQEIPINLLSLCQRADRMKTTITEN